MSTPSAANTTDAAALADELARARVVSRDRLTDLLADFPGGDAAALAEFLVGRGVLNRFQAGRALAGDARVLALGPYRLTGPHRTGTLGPTFRAEKPGRGGPGPFAVRVLPLRSLWQAKQAKQLARSLAALPPHPGLVPLADADSANGYHYLVWPLVEGETLADRVRSAGPLPPDRAAVVLAQLADALAVCHARQVVHGLLTPQAVALVDDDQPRLLELGAGALLANNLTAEESLFDTLSAAAVVAGMLDYAAPEQIADAARPTPASDQYALGSVGYLALTGAPPFADRLADLDAVARPLTEANPAVPAELGAVIDRMLRPDPADRYTGMDEVRELLAAIAGHPTPAAVSEPHQLSAPTSASRHTGRLTGQGSQAGNGSWGAAAGPARLPDRDDSEASVGFDLPDPAPEPDAPLPASRSSRSSVARGSDLALPLRPVDTPRSSVWETQSSGSKKHPLPGPGASQPAPVTPPPEVGPVPPVSANTPPPETRPSDRVSRLVTVRDPQPRPEPPTPTPPPSAPKVPAPQTRLVDAAEDLIQLPELPRLPAAPLLPVAPPTPAPPVLPPAVPPGGSVVRSSPGPGGLSGAHPPADAAEESPSKSILWKKLKKNLLFWQAAADRVQVSVFGPVGVVAGQTAKLSVFLHPPEAADSVRTQARAFQPEAELLGTGVLVREVAREAELAVHVAVDGAGVARPFVPVAWGGQLHRIGFELSVPWAAPGGPAAGLISVGKDDVRIGKAEFQLHVLARKAP